jgi:hypothetical protein
MDGGGLVSEKPLLEPSNQCLRFVVSNIIGLEYRLAPVVADLFFMVFRKKDIELVLSITPFRENSLEPSACHKLTRLCLVEGPEFVPGVANKTHFRITAQLHRHSAQCGT